MAIHQLGQYSYAKIAFAPAALTNGTQSGTGIDTNQSAGGPYRRATFVIDLNTGAATTANFVLQDSPDNSTWTSVTGGTLGTAQAASLSQQYVLDVNVAARNRYLRIQIVGTGTAGSASGDCLLYEGSTLAPTQDQTYIIV